MGDGVSGQRFGLVAGKSLPMLYLRRCKGVGS